MRADETSPSSPASPSPPPSGAASPSPLEGIRVLDLSRVLAGPFAGRMLADLGAEVVKVESPEGDVTRLWGKRRHGLAGYYTQQNAGKRSLCIDLDVSGGPELVAELARKADILIENFRPGVMARHDLAFADLAPLNPRLIMLSISGFGQHGPESQRAAYASVLHAESGFVARQATEDVARPTDPVLSIADFNAGLHGLVAALSALHLRGRTGRGQHIDLAMHDTMLMTDDYVNFSLDDTPPIRGGGEIWDAPNGEHIMITGDFRMIWKLLVKHHGLTDPTPPGADLDEKIRLRRESVAKFYVSFPDSEALTRALDEVNLAWGHVRTTAEALRSPTSTARGTVAEVDDRGGGVRTVIQSPYRFSDASSRVRGGPAFRGEHNLDVLSEWLDFSADDLDRLAAKGVILGDESREMETHR